VRVFSNHEKISAAEFGGYPAANGFTLHSAFRPTISCTVM
jgi:hypothetical protein